MYWPYNVPTLVPKNGSKTRPVGGRYAGPESSTTTSTVSSTAIRRHHPALRIVASATASKALSSRLVSTCWIWIASARTSGRLRQIREGDFSALRLRADHACRIPHRCVMFREPCGADRLSRAHAAHAHAANDVARMCIVAHDVSQAVTNLVEILPMLQEVQGSLGISQNGGERLAQFMGQGGASSPNAMTQSNERLAA